MSTAMSMTASLCNHDSNGELLSDRVGVKGDEQEGVGGDGDNRGVEKYNGYVKNPHEIF